MKKSIFLGLTFLFVYFSGFSQWVNGDFPSESDIYSVHFVDKQHGFAGGVATAGLYKTDDGGQSWQNNFNQSSDLLYFGGNKIHSVFFINKDTGFASGWNIYSLAPIIIKTVNGGENWSVPYLGPQFPGLGESYISSVFFKNPMQGYAVGTGGIALYSNDGGITWSRMNLNYNSNLNSIVFIDNHTGYIVGDNVILKSTDNGNSWTAKRIEGELFIDVKFADLNIGYAAGRSGSIYKTVDAGITWTKQKTYFTDYLSSLTVIDKDIVYAGGYDYIYKTTTGGELWERQPTSYTGKNTYTTYFTDSNTGIALGQGGKCIRTSNGGGNVAPFARFRFDNTFICEDSSNTFFNEGPSGYSYSWLVDNKIVSSSYNLTSSFFGTKSITLSLVAFNGYYRDTISQVITPISLKLKKALIASIQDTVCEFSGANVYVDSSEVGVAYYLRINGLKVGSSVFGNGNRISLPTGPIPVGGHLQVLAEKSNECGIKNISKDLPVFILELPDSRRPVIASDTLVCKGDSTSILILNSQKTVKYYLNEKYYLGNGDTLKLPTGRMTFNREFLIYQKNNCWAESSAMIQKAKVNISEVKAEFLTDKPLSVLGDTIQLTNTSTGSSFEWRFSPDIPAYQFTNPDNTLNIEYKTVGEKAIKLIASTFIGCKDSVQTRIKIAKTGKLSDLAICDSVVLPDNLSDLYSHTVTDLEIDKDGNRYFTGYCTKLNCSVSNLFLYKIGSDGQVKWRLYNEPTSIPSCKEEISTSVALDSDADGNLYLTGMFTGKRLNLGNQVILKNNESYLSIAYLIKLSPAGKVIWEVWGTGSQISPTDLFVKNNSVFVSISSSINGFKCNFPGGIVKNIGLENYNGTTSNILEVDLDGNYINHFSLQNPNSFSLGNPIYMAILNFLNIRGSGGDAWKVIGVSPKMVYDCQDNIHMMAAIIGTGDYRNGNENLSEAKDIIPPNRIQNNQFIATYNKYRGWIRNKGIIKIINNDGLFLDFIKLIKVDEFGNKYVAGSWGYEYLYHDNAPLIIIGSDTLRSLKNSFLIKISPSDEVIWYTLSEGVFPNSLELVDGKIVIYGTLNERGILGSHNEEDQAFKSYGKSDAFIAIYNQVGSLLKMHLIGGSTYDIATKMEKDNCGNIYFMLKDRMIWTGTPMEYSNPFRPDSDNHNIKLFKVNVSGKCSAGCISEVPICGGYSRDSIVITSPTGSFKSCKGDSMRIEWLNFGNAIVNIDYSIDSGKTYESIKKNLNADAGFYDWLIPESFNGLNQKLVLKISSGTTRDSVSLNVNFQIEQAVVSNLDSIYYVGDLLVTPSEIPSGGQFYIDGKFNGFKSFSPTTLGTGYHTLKYVVKNGACFSATNKSFLIRSEYSLKFQEEITYHSHCRGSIMGIRWMAKGVNSVDINYSADSGKTFIPIVRDFPADSGYVQWLVPENLPPHLIFQISDNINPDKLDTLTKDITFAKGQQMYIDAPLNYELNGGVIQPSVFPINGKLSGKGIIAGYLFSPELAGVGEHKIVYTYTYGLCMDTISAIFTVVKFDPSTNIPTVKATALSPSQIKVEWTRSPEAEEYTIMRGHNFGNQIIADHIPGNIVSYIDTNLVAGETYTYTVIATKRSLFYYSNPSEAVTLLPDGIDSKHDRILCNIYPDPSSGTFTIDIGTFVHGYTYVLSDVVGNIILEGPLTDEKTFIQLLDPIVNGLYNIRINKDGYILSRKILIIR